MRAEREGCRKEIVPDMRLDVKELLQQQLDLAVTKPTIKQCRSSIIAVGHDFPPDSGTYQACPTHAPPSTCSSSSSSCSFDVKIWEELHLNSLISVPSAKHSTEDLTIDAGLCDSPKLKEENVGMSKSRGFSFFSISPLGRGNPTKTADLASPHRLSNASSTLLGNKSGKRDAADTKDITLAPCFFNGEQLPVVKVIQTGSMSFTSEELVLQLMQPGKSMSSISPSPDENSDAKDATMQNLLITDYGGKSMHESSLEPREFASECARKEEKDAVDSASKAKFLHITPEDVYSAPAAPLKPPGAVPFKWEESPGKPKPCSDLAPFKPVPSLQLPPRLLYPPETPPNRSSPLARSQSKQYGSCSSPRRLENTQGMVSLRNSWHNLLPSGRRSYQKDPVKSRLNKAADDDPWSPTSILLGPEAGRPSLSSSSSASLVIDCHCASPGSNELHSGLTVDEHSSQSPGVPAEEDASLLSVPFLDLGPAPELRKSASFRKRAADGLTGLLRSCHLRRKWRRMNNYRRRKHEESEMWEPTLATYFHSMELERTSSVSGELQIKVKPEDMQSYSDLLARPAEGSSSSTSYLLATNCWKSLSSEGVGEDGVAPSQFSGGEEGGCHSICSKPLESLNQSHSQRKAKRRRARGWVLRRLRRSSRFLAAIWRAAGRSASNAKLKRRLTSYRKNNLQVVA